MILSADELKSIMKGIEEIVDIKIAAAINQHLDDYVHSEKPLSEAETQ